MKKILRSNWYFLIVLLLQILGGTFIVRPLILLLRITDIKLTLFISHFITLIVPAIIYFIVTKANVKDTLRLNKLNIKDVLLVILLAFLCQPVMAFFSVVTSLFFENNVANLMLDIVGSPYIILLLLIAVMPAITEEITIRGIVLSGYNKVNKYKAAIVTGIFFGMLHLDGQQFLYAASLGFILALVVRITNSIFSSCIIHFIFNGTSITLQKVLNRFAPDIIKATQQSGEISLINSPIAEKLIMLFAYGLMAVAFGTLVWLVLHYLQKRNPDKIDENLNYSDEECVTKEKILDIPFILSIVVFIGFMGFQIFLT